MKIGIVGAGNVGGTLGRRWQADGHTVGFATRETVAETCAAADVILVATPWPATEAALHSAGDLSGKILIDATNPILPDFSGLETGASGAQRVAQWAPGARVVKCFNTVGFNVMENTGFAGGKVAMLLCGDDPAARAVVAGLAAELGFDARDAGGLVNAGLLEHFAMLWITLAIKQGYGREFAFSLMQR